LSAKDGTPVDKTMDDTYKRVARALADVEQEPFVTSGTSASSGPCAAEPFRPAASRRTPGALEHKPATSTINCTVSGTIGDSMDDILNKVHEAGSR
jgi:ribonucleoside-diphosphate reductase alpha chain